jgi:hypothetical protein
VATARKTKTCLLTASSMRINPMRNRPYYRRTWRKPIRKTNKRE